MISFAQLSRFLSDNVSQNNAQTLSGLLRKLLVPRLHIGVRDGYFVNQGDAAISELTLMTGGLATCTALAIATKSHNFLCHADSTIDPKWLCECIGRLREIGGVPVKVLRFNCHGSGLNRLAERLTREALERANLMTVCEDVPDGISGLHTIVVGSPNFQGERIRAFLGKLQVA